MSHRERLTPIEKWYILRLLTDNRSITVNKGSQPMARTVKAPDERRSELVVTAQQLFYTKGYERTSVSDIVEAVGVAQGTFYYYFDSKTAVLEAIVDEAVDQVRSILEAIIADETLTAVAKWQQAIRAANNWKTGQKKKMLEVSRLLQMEENALLKHTLRQEAAKVTSGQFAKIIAQGVDEGVFTTPFVEESAEIVVAIVATLGDKVNELLFNPADYADPMTLALQMNISVQTAVERVLGAPAGSLTLIDEKTVTTWFTD